ncbi:MAG: EamA family transporter [Dehalobacterium sp.]
MKEKKSTSHNLAIFAYLAVCLFWGSTFLAIRIAVLDLPPMLSAGIRFILAGLIMLGFSYWKHCPLPTKDQVCHQSIVGLFLLLGGNGLVVIGSQWLHSSVAALLFATVPLFIAVEELILPGGEKLMWSGWLGLVIGFGGVALLVLTGQEKLGISFKGIVIILIGAISWASGSVYSKRIKSGGAMEVNLSIQMLAAGIGFVITGLLLGEASHASLSLNGVLAILYLIIFGSLLGYNAYIYLLSVWPMAKASTYAYVNPFVAIFLGHLILNEPITVFVFLGTAVILVGVFMVQFSGIKKKEPLDQLTV